MKKLFAILLGFALAFSLIACTNSGDGGKDGAKIEINLEANEIKLTVGDEYEIAATVKGDATISYSSSDASVLSLQGNKITALKAGNATVTVKAGDATATLKVVVEEAPEEIEIKLTTIEIKVGADYLFETTQDVTITSNNEEVVKVEGKKLIALKEGTAKVTIALKSNSSVKREIDVTVKPADAILVQGITLNGVESMMVGDTQTLEVVFDPANATDKSVRWISSSPAVATVVDGVVTALAEGTTSIAAVALDGSNTLGRITITVEKEEVTGSIELSAETTNIIVGSTVSIIATVTTSSDNKAITWSVDSDKAVVVEGLVTGVKRGTVNVVATLVANPEIKASIAISIKDKVQYISVEASKQIFDIGDEETLFCDVTPTSANENVTWSSSNENVATIDADGRLTIVGGGSCTITATAVDGSGVTGSIDIRVRYLVETITINGSNSMFVGENQNLTVTYSPTDVIRSVTWSSSDETVATVDGNGTVVPLKEGNVTITATAKDAGKVTGTLAITIEARVAETLCDPAVSTLEDGATYSYNGKEWIVGKSVFADIKKAVETASSKVYIAAGTYTDDFTIGASNFTVVGANAGVDPIKGTRSAETIIKGAITIASGLSNITVDGLAFTDTGSLTSGAVLNGITIKNCYIYDTNTNVAEWSSERSYTVEAVFKFVADSTGDVNNIVIENNKFSNVKETNIFFGRLKNVTVANNGFYNFQLDAIRGEGGYNTGKWIFDSNEFINDENVKCDNAIFLEAVSGSDTDGAQKIFIDSNVFKNIGGAHASSNYQCAIALGGFYQEKGLTTKIRANSFENCRVCVNARNNGGEAASFFTDICYNKFIGIPEDVYHRNKSKSSDTDATNPPLSKMFNNLYLDNDGNVITDLTTIAGKLIELASYDQGNYTSVADYEAAVSSLDLSK